LKILIVGNGPSHKDTDFIKNFDGKIIAVESVAQELIDNGVMPDYITWFEVTPKLVQDLVMSLLPNLKNCMLVHRNEECKRVYDEADKYVIHRIPFSMPSYVNNVGLFSIVFAQKVLRVKETHLIGLEHQGDDRPQERFDSMINEFNKYMATEQVNDSKLIDHSKGALEIHERDWYSQSH